MLQRLSSSRQWTIHRVVCMALTSVLHFILLALTAIALARGSAGPVQVAAITFNSCCLFSVAMFLLAKALYPQRQWVRRRNIWTFVMLVLFSFVVFVLFLARAHHRNSGGLIQDFASIGGKDACVGNIAVIIAAFAFAFAVVGLGAAFTSSYPNAKLVILPFRLGPGFSYPSPASRPLSPEPIWNERTMTAHLPDGRHLHLPMAPPHVDKNLHLQFGPRSSEWSTIRLH